MKRELESLAGDLEVDAPRTKRRKEQATTTQPTATTTEIANASNAGEKPDMNGLGIGQEGLKEQATRLWQVVRDAVNKEGNICSPPFMRLPLKRQYPDYFVVITQPICLDDIKKKIDDGRYPSLDHVRQDFELCFTNAKRYNMKDSPIWLDAKFLLKLANKEYSKITGKKVKKSGDSDDNGEEKGEGDGDDDKKKNKPPNMYRLLKARLQKLVEKTDDETHRVLSDVFMEMPSKKDYPTYYKEIKRPICIETIFKRLKRKEYSTSEEFANDVELVFSNALTFNQEHSQIWEDAVTLRDCFRQLMSDLPPPYSLARYTKATGKIRLKVPGAATAATTAIAASTSSPQVTAASKSQDQPTTQAPLTLRLPAASSVITTKNSVRASESSPQAATSVAPEVPIPAPAPTPVSAPAPATAQAPSPAPVAATPVVAPSPSIQTPTVAVPPKIAAPTPKVAAQPLTYAASTQYTHYPNAAYRQSTQSAATPQSSTVTSSPSTQQHTAHSVSRSPAPSLSGHRPLANVLIVTKPRGRPFWLDYRDGVKTWALRLGQGEQSLSVIDVKFLHDEGGNSSEEETRDDAEGAEEAEEVAPKKRGRGRPARGGKIKAAASGKKEAHSPKKTQAAITPPRENIQVVLNGTPTSAKSDQGIWEIELQIGTNVLELGEKGGHTWKVHMERPSIV
ncbi:Bromodomain-containing protein [Pisolithus thermaeus]|nr:Bromodomain-containing protein [Pisolithus thermaeus]